MSLRRGQGTFGTRESALAITGAAVALLLLPLAPAPLASQASRAATPPANAASWDAPAVGTLSPGDSVRITVWRKPELSGMFAVGADGALAHPLYNGVRVAGIPLPEAEAHLREVLLHYEAEPSFVLEPLFVIAVEGEVVHPGLYAMRPAATIAEAVARAGGPTATAGRDARVRVMHGALAPTYAAAQAAPSEQALRLGEEPRARLPVRSGDRIVIERHATFKDVVLPTLSTVGSLAAVAVLILRASGH
ncbi:MAG TPA: polysaccharide biosynthesis/export family protein [Gemmatimonadaceae bacterium]|nr:polysaccharide biosynthesis/export family protein [Gemmatimonadaceae bacterium]